MTTGAALLWASSFSVVKVGLTYIDPYSFVLLRFVVAAAVLLMVGLVTGQGSKVLRCMRDRYALLLGLTLSASFGLQFRGQTETTAAKAAVIINASVVLVAPMSVLLLRERMGLRKAAALGLGLCGVYLVTRSRGDGFLSTESLRGNLLVSGSALAYAFYVVLTKLAISRRTFKEMPLVTAVFVWSLPVFLVSGGPKLAAGLDIDRNAWIAIGYLAVFCSVLPFIIWTAALKYIGALTSAIVLLAELVFGVLIAHLFLGETLSKGVVAGCVLICAGILTIAKD
jgi:drug/metabolite transporter (DMT)-like permease